MDPQINWHLDLLTFGSIELICFQHCESIDPLIHQPLNPSNLRSIKLTPCNSVVQFLLEWKWFQSSTVPQFLFKHREMEAKHYLYCIHNNSECLLISFYIFCPSLDECPKKLTTGREFCVRNLLPSQTGFHCHSDTSILSLRVQRKASHQISLTV